MHIYYWLLACTVVTGSLYVNTFMQYTAVSTAVKIDNFQAKIMISFFFFFFFSFFFGGGGGGVGEGSKHRMRVHVRIYVLEQKQCIPMQTPILLYESGVKGGLHYTDMIP